MFRVGDRVRVKSREWLEQHDYTYSTWILSDMLNLAGIEFEITNDENRTGRIDGNAVLIEGWWFPLEAIESVELGLRVGDWVEIRSKDTIRQHTNDWNPEMETCCGMIARIERMEPIGETEAELYLIENPVLERFLSKGLGLGGRWHILKGMVIRVDAPFEGEEDV